MFKGDNFYFLSFLKMTYMKKIFTFTTLLFLLLSNLQVGVLYAENLDQLEAHKDKSVEALQKVEQVIDTAVHKIENSKKNSEIVERLSEKNEEIKEYIDIVENKIENENSTSDVKEIVAEAKKVIVLKVVSWVTEYENVEEWLPDNIANNSEKKEEALETIQESMEWEDWEDYLLIIKTKHSQWEVEKLFWKFDWDIWINLMYEDEWNNTFEVTIPNDSLFKEEMLEEIESWVMPETFLWIEIIKPEVFSIFSEWVNVSWENINETWWIEHYNTPNYLSLLKEKSDKKIKIWVIDTWIDYNHPDLKWRVLDGKDFVNKDDDAMDDQWHGTHVSGTIWANINGDWIIWVNPYVEFVPIKICTNKGFCPSYAVLRALEYSKDEKLDVLNMSLGWESNPKTNPICEGIASNIDAGVIVISASGNSNMDTSRFVPGWCEWAITVWAIDKNMNRASFSNFGSQVDVAAPWVKVYSTLPSNRYRALSWTSMATPHVVGLVSIMKAFNSDLDQESARALLKKFPIDVNTDWWKSIASAIDVEKLISFLSKSDTVIEEKTEQIVEDEKDNSWKIRYIRDWSNKSNKNWWNFWVEIKALERWTWKNIALWKTVSWSVPEKAEKPYSRITDWKVGNNSYFYTHPNTANILSNVVVDLWWKYDISDVNVTHYYTDWRTFNDTKTEVSVDGINWTVLFDSTVDWTYAEPKDWTGRTYKIPAFKPQIDSLVENWNFAWNYSTTGKGWIWWTQDSKWTSWIYKTWKVEMKNNKMTLEVSNWWYIEVRNTNKWYYWITPESIKVEPNTVYTIEYDYSTQYISWEKKYWFWVNIQLSNKEWIKDVWVKTTPYINETKWKTHVAYTFTTWPNSYFMNVSPVMYGHWWEKNLNMKATISDLTIVQKDYSKSTSWKVRYIRDWANWSNKNSGSHWIEIQAIDSNGVNKAIWKEVILFWDELWWNLQEESKRPLSLITDGIGKWWNRTWSREWRIMVDLWKEYQISEVNILHYFSDWRTYNNTKTEVSVDGINWTVLFDSAVSWTYVESKDWSGRTYKVPSISETIVKEKIEKKTQDTLVEKKQEEITETKKEDSQPVEKDDAELVDYIAPVEKVEKDSDKEDETGENFGPIKPAQQLLDIDFWDKNGVNINNNLEIDESLIETETLWDTIEKSIKDQTQALDVQTFWENGLLDSNSVEINSNEGSLWKWELLIWNYDENNLPPLEEKNDTKDLSDTHTSEQNWWVEINSIWWDNEIEFVDAEDVFIDWAEAWIEINSVWEEDFTTVVLEEYNEKQEEDESFTASWEIEEITPQLEELDIVEHTEELVIDWAEVWVEINSAWDDSGEEIIFSEESDIVTYDENVWSWSAIPEWDWEEVEVIDEELEEVQTDDEILIDWAEAWVEINSFWDNNEDLEELEVEEFSSWSVDWVESIIEWETLDTSSVLSDEELAQLEKDFGIIPEGSWSWLTEYVWEKIQEENLWVDEEVKIEWIKVIWWNGIEINNFSDENYEIEEKIESDQDLAKVVIDEQKLAEEAEEIYLDNEDIEAFEKLEDPYVDLWENEEVELELLDSINPEMQDSSWEEEQGLEIANTYYCDIYEWWACSFYLRYHRMYNIHRSNTEDIIFTAWSRKRFYIRWEKSWKVQLDFYHKHTKQKTHTIYINVTAKPKPVYITVNVIPPYVHRSIYVWDTYRYGLRWASYYYKAFLSNSSLASTQSSYYDFFFKWKKAGVLTIHIKDRYGNHKKSLKLTIKNKPVPKSYSVDVAEWGKVNFKFPNAVWYNYYSKYVNGGSTSVYSFPWFASIHWRNYWRVDYKIYSKDKRFHLYTLKINVVPKVQYETREVYETRNFFINKWDSYSTYRWDKVSIAKSWRYLRVTWKKPGEMKLYIKDKGYHVKTYTIKVKPKPPVKTYPVTLVEWKSTKMHLPVTSKSSRYSYIFWLTSKDWWRINASGYYNHVTITAYDRWTLQLKLSDRSNGFLRYIVNIKVIPVPPKVIKREVYETKNLYTSHNWANGYSFSYSKWGHISAWKSRYWFYIKGLKSWVMNIYLKKGGKHLYTYEITIKEKPKLETYNYTFNLWENIKISLPEEITKYNISNLNSRIFYRNAKAYKNTIAFSTTKVWNTTLLITDKTGHKWQRYKVNITVVPIKKSLTVTQSDMFPFSFWSRYNVKCEGSWVFIHRKYIRWKTPWKTLCRVYGDWAPNDVIYEYTITVKPKPKAKLLYCNTEVWKKCRFTISHGWVRYTESRKDVIDVDKHTRSFDIEARSSWTATVFVDSKYGGSYYSHIVVVNIKTKPPKIYRETILVWVQNYSKWNEKYDNLKFDARATAPWYVSSFLQKYKDSSWKRYYRLSTTALKTWKIDINVYENSDLIAIIKFNIVSWVDKVSLSKRLIKLKESQKETIKILTGWWWYKLTTQSRDTLRKSDVASVDVDNDKWVENKIRYIRDWANGSNKNNGNHWVEIQAFTSWYSQNIARGKKVISNNPKEYAPRPYSRITDGNLKSWAYASGWYWHHYMQVDLWSLYDIEAVKVLHYYADWRTYKKTKTEVSSDGKTWRTIFNSAVNGTYSEPKDGSWKCRFNSLKNRVKWTIILWWSRYSSCTNWEMRATSYSYIWTFRKCEVERRDSLITSCLY